MMRYFFFGIERYKCTLRRRTTFPTVYPFQPQRISVEEIPDFKYFVLSSLLEYSISPFLQVRTAVP
jgi:hypothetical protein